MGLKRGLMNCDSKGYEILSFCHEDNEKKRCPHCLSLETKKKGYTTSFLRTERGQARRRLQRYSCHDCGKSFSSKNPLTREHASIALKQKAVLEYVWEKSTSREVALRNGVHHTTILNWLQELGKTIQPGPFPPPQTWSGYVSFDGKETKVKGRRRSILIGVDAHTGYPFHHAIGEAETLQLGKRFFEEFRKHYPININGITSDFGKGKCFIGLVDEELPDIPHQICLVHFQRYFWLFLPRTKRSEFYWRNAVLKELMRRIVLAKDRKQSLLWLKRLEHFKPFFRARYHQRFLKSIERNYAWLTAYYEDPDLPNNTNISENINRQLMRKLKTTDGFKSDESLAIFLKLWFRCYQLNHLKIERDQWANLLWK